MAEALEIRNYNPGTDYHQVKQILEEGGLFYDPIDAPERLAEKVKRDPESIMVATAGNQLIGTVRIMDDGSMPFIFRLAVRENQRRHGVGARLMEEAENRLRKRGFAEIHLLVNEEDEEVRDYYQKQGWEEGNLYRWMYKER